VIVAPGVQLEARDRSTPGREPQLSRSGCYLDRLMDVRDAGHRSMRVDAGELRSPAMIEATLRRPSIEFPVPLSDGRRVNPARRRAS
jgi:hypothetical protein